MGAILPGMGTARRTRIPIIGLGCGGAGAADIERRLRAAEGIEHVYVNPATEIAYVAYDPARTDVGALVHVIEQLGFRAGRPVEA